MQRFFHKVTGVVASLYTRNRQICAHSVIEIDIDVYPLYSVPSVKKKNGKATQSTLSERFWSISAVCIQRNQTYLQNHILLYACNYIIHTCTSVECVCIRTSTSTICTFHDAFWRVVNNSLAALMSGKAPKVPGEVFPLRSSEVGVGFYTHGEMVLVFWDFV